VSSLAKDSLVIVSDWLDISLLYNVGITITLHSFTYLFSLVFLFRSVASFLLCFLVVTSV